MSKSVSLISALIPVCGLVLASCGGGEEDSGLRFRLSDVNGESAILITGGSPPDVSAAEARSERAEILSRTNLVHRVVMWVDYDESVSRGDPSSFDRDADCDPDTCFVGAVEPIMTKNGIPLYRVNNSGYGNYGDDTRWYDNLRYGGWMDHSEFWVDAEIETFEGDFEGARGRGWAWGAATKTNPTTGPFVWTGVMVGRNSDLESTRVSNVIQGDAAISTELSQAGNMSVDVAFSNIKDLNTGGSIADIAWSDLPVVDGSFETSTILGSFFGTQHEEVVGVFQRNDIIGAFGARR